MRQKHKHILGILLTFAIVVGLMTGMSLTAYADDAPPYANLKNTTTVVTFDGKYWYLIDYDNSTVTLLSKECVGASVFGDNSTYSGSTVENYVNNWYTNNISANAKTAVSGGAFLLTIDQAKAIYYANANVLKCSQASGAVDNHWWLCSPANNEGAGDVKGDLGDGVFNSGAVSCSLGVRPALQLNLSSVTFSSETNTFSLKVAVTEVSINKSSTSLAVGGTETLTAAVAPSNATDSSVSWSSNNTAVATVDSSGTVTGVAPGTATITVTTMDGSKTASCAVTVSDKITIANTLKLKKAKAQKGKVTVTWKKIKKTKKTKALLKQIKSIQVQYSTDPTFNTNVASKNVGKKKSSVKLKLQRKTVYYVRMRYVGSDGYSNWSGVKVVKTK